MATFRIARRVLAALVLSVAFAAAALAQTTGGIVGRVTDETGGVLPGVTVSAASPALQGTRATVTDGTGSYRLTLLPPGVYTLTFDLAGFASERAEEVVVSLGRDTTLAVVMRPRRARRSRSRARRR